MDQVNLIIDGQWITVPRVMTILEASQTAGIHVPTLCYDPDLKPYGACRLCIVQIEGIRGLPTSCTTAVQEGMVVHTQTDEVRQVRRTIVEMAIAKHPQDCL
ncbi:MAG: (2Fe-2S)-binding protein, partial [Deltaproteobacteria bacterium]